ncbi:zinc finger BED domain-containing protein DAYSLEEPER-like [Lycium barbarum]|uniref:zinc finger BED domain-containing protein DAYSLEEPER-like n=1 Tax=Lycium barbarum TaxID=112863 RepID=UPI00293F5629|nr:zinc finger BED domain-containing protein DAYSLEEPER-like [Lycium barbarum]
MADETRLSLVGSTDTVPNTDDSNDNSLDTEPQVTKKRKNMKSRSDVWEHFDKVIVNGIVKAKCRHCKNLYAANTSVNGTTGLRQHIALRCIPYKAKSKTSTQKKINFASTDEHEPRWEFDQQLIRRALVEMIIIDELPFSFVEKEGFKKFMQVAQPLFQVPSRRTVTRDCYGRYDELRLDLKKSFREAKAKIFLTTDTWTSLQRINYMCLTAHFIDRDWVLHKKY